MTDGSVLVVQIGRLGKWSALQILEHYGLKQNFAYLLFDNAEDPLFAQIKPQQRQLIFISHDENFDSGEVAKEIKEKNPEAIVFAFVSASVSASEIPISSECKSEIDGVFKTSTMDDSAPSEIFQAFKEGEKRSALIRLLKGLNESEE